MHSPHISGQAEKLRATCFLCQCTHQGQRLPVFQCCSLDIIFRTPEEICQRVACAVKQPRIIIFSCHGDVRRSGSLPEVSRLLNGSSHVAATRLHRRRVLTIQCWPLHVWQPLQTINCCCASVSIQVCAFEHPQVHPNSPSQWT
jgi:hypothetical protein